jgi:deoxyribonuclease-4
VGVIRFGPSRLPSRESAEAAVGILQARGHTACEIDFEGGFWMDYDFAGALGEAAHEAGIVLSVHAPIAAFLGHAERGKKLNLAMGMLDHSAGVAVALDAELVVFHPGFLLGREREQALADVVQQLGELRARLEPKGRLVPFGVEVMGRVRELGSAEDVLEIAAAVPWVRPVIDFAHLHATSDGAYTDVESFASVLEAADAVLEPGAPFHIHFSDIAYANRNETRHLSYGEGTLRAEPLGETLARFERPATVISEAPDEESTQAIWAALSTWAAPVAESTRSTSSSGASPHMRAGSDAASASRPRSRRN